jgi:hypothetical protein
MESMTEHQESKYLELSEFGWEYEYTNIDGNIIMQRYEYINNSRFKNGLPVSIDKAGNTKEIEPN